jgi:hypothetical protein
MNTLHATGSLMTRGSRPNKLLTDARHSTENIYQQRSKGTRGGTACGEGFHKP